MLRFDVEVCLTFQQQPLAICPQCNQPRLRIAENRKTPDSVRRRKVCDACDHRLTTHEITEEAFKASKDNAALVQRLRKLLAATIPQALCKTCTFNDGDACNFELPEYNTPDAADCSNYQQ